MKSLFKFFFLTLSFICSLQFVQADEISTKLSGKILLQVESNGEAWYINPTDNKKYYLGRPDDAFQIMRKLGLGISEKSYNSFNKYAPKSLSGKILLRVEANGEAYYVNPNDLKIHYLGRPTDAFQIMRTLGLGISNNDLNKIETSKSENTKYYTVINVIDGDTIKINKDEKTETLRLIGIDTPESVHPTKTVECYGLEASNKTKELLLNKKISIESDLTQDIRDKYDRLLVYVFLEDGTNFNKWMIENGFAYEYTYSKAYKYQTEFKSTQETAKNKQLGLWKTCENQITTENQVASTSHIFYTSNHYSSEKYYCDTDSAWKNLSEKYLESYTIETKLLEKYPTKTLNEPCK